MKKIMVISAVMSMLAMAVSLSVEQEFIKQPKEKKICPSRQQHIEQKAAIVDAANDIVMSLTSLSQEILSLQHDALKEIKGYVDGDKSCSFNSATKKDRIVLYDKALKAEQVLQKISQQISGMRQRVSELTN